MKKIITVLVAVMAAIGVFATETTDIKMDVSQKAWKCYGDVTFNANGSITLTVPKDQKNAYSFITLKTPTKVKPGEVMVVSLKAKGEKGRVRIAAFGYHAKRKGFRFGDVFFKVESNKFKNIDYELMITQKKFFEGVLEGSSPCIMLSGKGSKLVIKDIKIVLEKDSN